MPTTVLPFLKYTLGLLLMGGALTHYLARSVRFESIESKTIDNHPVFNQVSFISGATQDIWRMRQSHLGEKLDLQKWDELMIKVDKSRNPFEVSYHQLRSGKEIEYKVSCVLCHANGPRAIRAQSRSSAAPLSVSDKISLGVLNLRIRAYPKMKVKHIPLAQVRKVPLKYEDKAALNPLKVASCTMCHHDGFLGRGTLTLQQGLPIAHLMKNKQMPPWPFTVSRREREQIENFLKGF